MSFEDNLLESKIYDIVTNAMIEHDQAIINTFKELANNAAFSDEAPGINRCIYILESLIERRRKEKDASERDGEYF